MSVREDIAAAASQVVGVHVTPGYRQDSTPGQGYVRLHQLGRSANGYGYMDTWQVVLFMPQDINAAEAWLEDNLTTLVDAISSELIVTTATPSQIPLDSGTVPGLVIEGARAHE